MNGTKALVGRGAIGVAADRTENTATVLAVGDTHAWSSHGRRLPSDGHIYFADFHEVSRELLAQLTPRLVVSPLLARNFDCVDLAQRLGELRYAGRYRALGPSLPDPGLITREVRSLVPTLDFDVLPLA